MPETALVQISRISNIQYLGSAKKEDEIRKNNTFYNMKKPLDIQTADSGSWWMVGSAKFLI